MRDPVTHTAGEARAALARLNLSQRAVCEATGKSPNYWSRRLSGETPMSVADVVALSEITGVPVSELVGAA